jgi:hypothetical protein
MQSCRVRLRDWRLARRIGIGTRCGVARALTARGIKPARGRTLRSCQSKLGLNFGSAIRSMDES